MDQTSVQDRVTPRTRAIIITHPLGHPATGLAEWRALREQRGMVLIEDCAQAQSAEYEGHLCGTVQQHQTLNCGEGG